MTQSPQPQRLPPLKPLLTSAAVLAAVLAVTCAVAAAIVYPQHGPTGVAAAVTAAGICLLAGVLGLIATVWFQGTPTAVSGMLMGMLIRMALPMAMAVALKMSGSPLAEAGVVGLIVVHYLVGLSVDTVMAMVICGTQQATNPPPSS